MRKELDDRLVKAFPNLYIDRYGDMQQTCMCWGFPDDGWFDLIWECSEKIEAEILKMPEEQRKLTKAIQVKEKFGTLRFYMWGHENEAINEAIRVAEEKSEVTCEQCGSPGELYGGGWLLTLCKKCAAKSKRSMPYDEWRKKLEEIRKAESKKSS